MHSRSLQAGIAKVEITPEPGLYFLDQDAVVVHAHAVQLSAIAAQRLKEFGVGRVPAEVAAHQPDQPDLLESIATRT